MQMVWHLLSLSQMWWELSKNFDCIIMQKMVQFAGCVPTTCFFVHINILKENLVNDEKMF